MNTIDLPQEMRELGRKIVISLDMTQDKPTSAFWFYSDSNEWILCLVSSMSKSNISVDQNEIADRVQIKISELTSKNVPFAIMETENDLIQAMSNFFVTESDTIGQIEFKNNTVNNFLIRSVYAYRLTV